MSTRDDRTAHVKALKALARVCGVHTSLRKDGGRSQVQELVTAIRAADCDASAKQQVEDTFRLYEATFSAGAGGPEIGGTQTCSGGREQDQNSTAPLQKFRQK